MKLRNQSDAIGNNYSRSNNGTEVDSNPEAKGCVNEPNEDGIPLETIDD